MTPDELEKTIWRIIVKLVLIGFIMFLNLLFIIKLLWF